MIGGGKISSVTGHLGVCGAPRNGRSLPHGDDQSVSDSNGRQSQGGRVKT